MSTCTCGPNEACSDCPTNVLDLQVEVVVALQKQLLHRIEKFPTAGLQGPNWSRDLKDLAVAIGVAFDHLRPPP